MLEKGVGGVSDADGGDEKWQKRQKLLYGELMDRIWSSPPSPLGTAGYSIAL